MSQISIQHIDERKAWRIAFLALSTFVIIVMLLLSHSYGQSGDEAVQIIYGHDIWNYFVHGDKQALDYSMKSMQFQKQELYGGFFDFLMDAIHEWVPSIPILIIRHFFNALTGALMMIFTGLLAFRISRKWSVGFLALLFIFLSPRIFGESMNNPKDIPFGCGFIIAMYYFLALMQDFPNKRLKHAIGLAIGFSIAFGVRSAGGILELAYFLMFAILYYLLQKDARNQLLADNRKLMKQLIGFAIAAIVAGYIIGLLFWPWGLQSPIANPIASLKGMTNRETVLPVLFEGEYHENFNMPWYYEFKWIFISNPLIVIAGFLIFIILAMRARKRYGWFAIIFLLFCALFPLLYMIYKKSSVYDTWRHVFFVYPFWVVMSALGFDLLGDFIKKEKLKIIPKIIAFAGLLPVVVWMIESHPNEYVYFNELVGGVKGALGEYDLDYYQNTSKQAADWMLANVKPIPGRKILVLSNMSGFDHYFAKDTGWIVCLYGRYNERSQKEWDYYIANPRYLSAEVLQDSKWVPENVIHTINVKDIPLSVIIARKSRVGIPAFDSFQKKDYAAAAALYAEYLKSDTTDENVYFYYGISLASIGQIDAGIAAMKRATDLDPSQAQFFEILAKLYDAKGDKASAQNAMSRAQSIAERQQELQGDKSED